MTCSAPGMARKKSFHQVRLRPAVDLLRDNGLAREAFRFANQAMLSACLIRVV